MRKLLFLNCVVLQGLAFDTTIPSGQVINWTTENEKTFTINGSETLVRGRTGWNQEEIQSGSQTENDLIVQITSKLEIELTAILQKDSADSDPVKLNPLNLLIVLESSQIGADSESLDFHIDNVGQITMTQGQIAWDELATIAVGNLLELNYGGIPFTTYYEMDVDGTTVIGSDK